MIRPIPVLWSRWIEFLSLLLIVYALAMVFVPEMMSRTLVGPLLFYHDEVLRSAFTRLTDPDLIFVNVLNGLIGSVTMGWAIVFSAIASGPFRKGETWSWNALTAGVTAWAIVEAYVKLTHGLGVWSLAHISLLVAYGVPLLATYRHFHRSVPVASGETNG